MEIVSDLRSFQKKKYPNLVVALGNFDGVHLGHLKILSTISERAKKISGAARGFTFREHPQRVLHRKDDPPILTSPLHKLVLLKQACLDLCFLVDFTPAFSLEEPEDFVRQVLLETLGAQEICLGFNAKFGHARSGDSALMRKLSEKYHFKFSEAPPFEVDGQVVSSSLIRSLVREGKLTQAAQFLGRPYSFFGTVVSGAGRGRNLGFPTANLDPQSEVMPPEGVYAAWLRVWNCRLVTHQDGSVKLEDNGVGERLKAVLNYGRRPTFGGNERPVPEVHILGMAADHPLTDKTVEVTVGERLRSERSFSGPEALRGQIERDIESAKKWFSNQLV